jgi:hypothetical protein
VDEAVSPRVVAFNAEPLVVFDLALALSPVAGQAPAQSRCVHAGEPLSAAWPAPVERKGQVRTPVDMPRLSTWSRRRRPGGMGRATDCPCTATQLFTSGEGTRRI